MREPVTVINSVDPAAALADAADRPGHWPDTALGPGSVSGRTGEEVGVPPFGRLRISGRCQQHRETDKRA